MNYDPTDAVPGMIKRPGEENVATPKNKKLEYRKKYEQTTVYPGESPPTTRCLMLRNAETRSN
jgi:hypothetical protein